MRIGIDVGIIVANLEESLGFYQDNVGLKIVAEVNTSLIGKGRMVKLAHGQSLIKLIEFDDPPAPNRSNAISDVSGIRYITLLIEDIESMMRKARRNQMPVEIDITELGNGTKIAIVKDPDGNFVEFVQESQP